jgi:SAM-dependent methyltransferase
VTPREAEIARYEALYARHGETYRTTPRRLDLFSALIAERPDLAPGGLLDVGTGHGTMLRAARTMGPATGTEVVPALTGPGVVLAPAWSLPFATSSFATVACFDVLEHLLESDVSAALREIGRVAASRILVEVSCRPSRWRDDAGQLHMTIWEPGRWLAAASEAWQGWAARLRVDRPLEPAAALIEATPAA